MEPRVPQDEASRREFLTRIGQTSLAIAGVTGAALWLHNRPTSREPESVSLKRYGVALGPSDPRLAIAHGNSVEAMVRAAVGELGGMARFVGKDDVVLIKPNVAFDRSPRLAATTHPDTLKAVIRLCRDAGARKVIVADNPINSPEGAFSKSGIRAAAEEAGAVVMYPRSGDFRVLRVDGEVLTTWPAFYTPLAEATKVIGVAPVKDHNLCGASLTMKNWYGLLGGTRNRFHQRIHDVIADLAFMITPTLVFLDATRVLMTNGPTGGRLSDVAPGDTIVCGVDQVAVDAYGVTKLGRDPYDIEYLRRAHARGIGDMDWRGVIHREISV
jgi:uncharacterized protein (DUF362 family)